MANSSDEIQLRTLIKLSAFFYFSRSRALLFVLALLFAAASTRAQTKIRSLTNVIDGHAVGGVTIDLVGNIYVADFGDVVWKITPEGKRHVFASGLYGASGNAIDNEGNLLQSNFYGDSITKIDRKGQAQPFVTSGLSGPVGIAVNRQTGDVYVANCRGISIAKIATDGTVSSLTKSAFQMPKRYFLRWRRKPLCRQLQRQQDAEDRFERRRHALRDNIRKGIRAFML